ncbi:uncharacterized protein SAPINGB_P005254 [Magnusiomyces paraingens]|uniref:Ion transport domain-containing protein n=1 Tax=Magnusiomyces paraingens TaxID=2606893 RepID=A0A5E8BZ92_9ASCO|nr:uncharacterized protein SAPINGB_P005254 [Saprochaete ingens]VVT56764.1 unnamed protein product [Saprochaete ingens]
MSSESLLPTVETDAIPRAYRPSPKHTLKIALRIKELIDILVPIQFDESVITRADSPVITDSVLDLVREAAGGKGDGAQGSSSRRYRAPLIFLLLTVKRWYDDMADQQLFDADLFGLRASAAESIAQRLIDSQEDERYLFRDMLCQRYSITLNGEDSDPASALELAVDLHSTPVISSGGYQRCIKWLWNGWIVQSVEDPDEYVFYKSLGVTDWQVHFDPDRLKTPKYQNYVQLFFCLLYLLLYTLTINTLKNSGNFDAAEFFFFFFTLGGIVDDALKFYHVGLSYFGFWNMFNDTMYFLVATSFFFRLEAFTHSSASPLRESHLMISYRILACCAPFVWLRILLYLESLQFFGAMLIVLTQMIRESVIFFVLLVIICLGFLQAFIGLDFTDETVDLLPHTINTMLLTIMASPDFDAFTELAAPYGTIVYYFFAFLITTLLLNILIALFGSAYSHIYDNATEEYLALVASKTLRFIRAPDSYVYVPPLNLIEVLFVLLPFGWTTDKQTYEKINHYVMYLFYWPVLIFTATAERQTARRVKYNRLKGLDDDANEHDQEWDLLDGFHNGDFDEDELDDQSFPTNDNDDDDEVDPGIAAIRRRIRTKYRLHHATSGTAHDSSAELEQMNAAIAAGDPEFPIDEKAWRRRVLLNAPKVEVGSKSGAGWQNYWLVKDLHALQKDVSRVRKELGPKTDDGQSGIILTKEELGDIVKAAVAQALEENKQNY